MGKSTVSEMLRQLGVPVHDSDHEVHDMLLPGGDAYHAVCAAFPYFSYPKIYGAAKKSGREINRKALGNLVFNDDAEREKLEKIVHPFVRGAQNDFIRVHRALGLGVVALDIPLLFETGGERLVDYTLVVSAPKFIQQARVLARPGMSLERFHAILKRQMPDEEKRARADFIVQTGLNRAHTMKQLRLVLGQVKKGKTELVDA